jgi:hemolysin-activating ACP:hemolysin acyltransferase
MEREVQNRSGAAVMADKSAAGDAADFSSGDAGAAIKITDAPQGKAPLSQAERDLAARLASASVADAVGLMMRSAQYRHYSLADLEWLILPPLMLGQVLFAYTRPKGQVAAGHSGVGEQPPMPVAMITWALVSTEVDAKLVAQKGSGAPLRLSPQEWRSGSQRRVISLLGDQRALRDLETKLATEGK